MFPLLTPTYWLDTTPVPFSWLVDLFHISFSIAILVGSIAAFLWVNRSTSAAKELRRAVEDAAWSSLWVALAGLFLFVVEYQRVPVLSMRVWWLVWGAWILWIVWDFWKTFGVELPLKKHAQHVREASEKWLPKPKR